MATPPDSPKPVTIAILAKAPVPGTVKTRLAMMLGVYGAATLQERLIVRTVETAVEAGTGPVHLWTSPDERHPCFKALIERFSLPVARQPKGDLGARMHAAFVHAAGPAIVIGSDCPVLTPQHLRDAADALRNGADATVCPSDDGGYVLIGLRKPEPTLFQNMIWSTDTVMTETRHRLTHRGLSWREPAQLWDVDRPTDVRRMRREGLKDLLADIDHEVSPLRVVGRD
jgi:rSAM/selenodomain-associated transferase 1